MSYALWIFVIAGSYLVGRFTAPQELSKTDEHLAAQNQALQEDVAYYKRLTHNLVEENKQLRQNARV